MLVFKKSLMLEEMGSELYESYERRFERSNIPEKYRWYNACDGAEVEPIPGQPGYYKLKKADYSKFQRADYEFPEETVEEI